jgi:beta-N-acetylhexosaminidase
VHNQIDPNTPASISKVWIDKIRNEIGFQGLVVSDCLHMGAIIKEYDLEQTVIKGLNAGLDLLLFSNNPLASGSILTDGSYVSDNGNIGHIPDINLPQKFKDIVIKGLAQGNLQEDKILASIKRVKEIKKLV